MTTPKEKLLQIRFQMYQNVCLRLAQEYGILQALSESDTMTVKQLSETTKADTLLIGMVEVSSDNSNNLIVRIMRLIASIGIADEIGPAKYKANETTHYSVRKGIIGDVKWRYVLQQYEFIADSCSTDIAMRVCRNVGPMASQSKLHQFDRPDPHTYTLGKAMFPYLSEHRDYGQAFEDFMTGRPAVTLDQLFYIYPAKLKIREKPLKQNGTLLVDVAGGRGFYTQ